eukprot:6198371-Pleurochrysis_carterae.AAC.2
MSATASADNFVESLRGLENGLLHQLLARAAVLVLGLGDARRLRRPLRAHASWTIRNSGTRSNLGLACT